MPDDLSFGPIKNISRFERNKWNREQLGYHGEDANYGYSDDAFWSQATRPDLLPILWLHRRCAREYANFLEFVWRFEGVHCRLVDLTDIDIHFRNGESDKSRTSGEFTHKQIIESSLIDLQIELTQRDREYYKMTWENLKLENAPLRVVTETSLISADISNFDSLILSFVSDEWTKCARVVADVEMSGPYAQTGSFLLWPRLRVLVDAGLIEGRGKMIDMRESFVRSLRPKPDPFVKRQQGASP